MGTGVAPASAGSRQRESQLDSHSRPHGGDVTPGAGARGQGACVPERGTFSDPRLLQPREAEAQAAKQGTQAETPLS